MGPLRDSSGQSAKLTKHLRLMTRLKSDGAIPVFLFFSVALRPSAVRGPIPVVDRSHKTHYTQ